ncbi:hypothetical protein M409DRAFT_20757 [Zasmidium cellare ATCC 36951]|uniref:Enoyl reductase (ER) domain-containing protein n=1 Tax=Zasmidium cellare ATCC 36951 TaxID=1080233 RepID=A0A6A6CSJ5_ZASCE|nr:uncharacterized protein M409DRAFT_20757 [Zasmidium cellare ATCC 36951]KAF2168739.1 hypothetical protein M409DRAFT_20757 [Zasmidium cellare ATCC 36951]
MTGEEVPKKCFAGITVNEGPDFKLEVQEVDVPEPGPGELLLKLNCTGLCGSDIHYMTGDLGLRPSSFGVVSTGHEGAGVVVKLGPQVDQNQWKVGDRAGIKPIWNVCHNCEQCWNGIEQYCSQARHTGISNTGSYQQYVVSPAIYTPKIPDGVPDEVAGPIMCSAATMHRALVDSGLKAGNWVVFPGGGGGVGIQGVQLAKTMGMRPIVIDGGEQKKTLCIEHGAEEFIDFRETSDVAGTIKKIADGIGAHGVLVTAWQSYKDSISFLGDRVGGKVMCIGLPPADQNVVVGDSPTHLAMKKMSIQGTIVGTLQDIASALEYARRGLLKPIHEVRGKGAWAESVDQLKNGKVAGRIVIDFNKD